MNRFLLPILILLWSLLYTGWWNCNRKPLCSGEPMAAAATPAVVAPSVDTVKIVDAPPPAPTAEEQILFAPLDVYFDVNQAGIKKNPEVENFLTTAKKYFAKYPEKQLLVTGHTDSDGSDDSNQKLSERRANQTKTFLLKEGFKAAQIATDGKGETAPVASNDTDEGKGKNRRSTIRLKE